MKITKIIRTRKLFTYTFVGIVLFLAGTFLLKPTPEASSPLLQAHVLAAEEVKPIGVPARLKIPKLNVDAAIDPAGLNSHGEMEAPSSPHGLAWYKLGPRPGDKGNAVIAGHYGRWKNGEGSVFDKLDTLAKGDTLYVEDTQGTTITFVIRDFRIFAKNDDASTVFMSSDTKAHLNLITCQGTWEEAQKSYSNRFVVFADKE